MPPSPETSGRAGEFEVSPGRRSNREQVIDEVLSCIVHACEAVEEQYVPLYIFSARKTYTASPVVLESIEQLRASIITG